MRHVIISLLGLFLAACAHTAVAPVSSPSGEAVVIQIPGVPKGGKPKASQVMAIDEMLLEGMTPDTLIWRYFPELEGKGSAEATVVGLVGETKTKGGETICAYLPIVGVRATAPAARVEEAAARMGADMYRKAKKNAKVYPLSQIADKPKS
ncbi:hypothetical protein [Luteolibacter marinus]|uniref:hypothetical protein n=1 Tax=Luteolibacter marinus TaxID=2776705 RepID=UPI00186611EF|nr:hypothetical protein [Luteolibacter marinus]